jgi:hypothetical protein
MGGGVAFFHVNSRYAQVEAVQQRVGDYKGCRTFRPSSGVCHGGRARGSYLPESAAMSLRGNCKAELNMTQVHLNNLFWTHH